ncbi:MAG: hypothetical protein ABSC95_29320 [Acetobacteraceae bacterium]
MPDMPVEPTSPGRYPADMESRVAVLEQIARTMTASLERIEREQRSDFRWLLGITLAGFTTSLGMFGALLGAMAHGFHWL